MSGERSAACTGTPAAHLDGCPGRAFAWGYGRFVPCACPCHTTEEDR